MPKTTSSLRGQHTYPGPVKRIQQWKNPGLGRGFCMGDCTTWDSIEIESYRWCNLHQGGPRIWGESRQFFLSSLLPQNIKNAKSLKTCQCAKPMNSPVGWSCIMDMATIYLKLAQQPENWRHFGKHFPDKTTFTYLYILLALDGVRHVPERFYQRMPSISGWNTPSFCPSMFLAVPSSPLNPARPAKKRHKTNKKISRHAILVVVFCSSWHFCYPKNL